MANYGNYEEQGETFDSSNYGQRLLHTKRQAKIVSPMFNRGFNYANMKGKFSRRKEEETIASEKESELDTSSDLPEKKSETKSSPTKSENNSGGKISNFLSKFANNKKAKTAVSALTKAKKIKIYLICGGALLIVFFIIIMFFAVFSGGGSEMTGGSFNEVSEYELNNDDEEYDEDYDEEYSEEWGQE